MFVNSQDSNDNPDKSSSVKATDFSDSSYHPTQSQSQVSDCSNSSDFLDDEPTGPDIFGITFLVSWISLLELFRKCKKRGCGADVNHDNIQVVAKNGNTICTILKMSNSKMAEFLTFSWNY